MIVFLIVLLVLVIGAVVALVLGRTGGMSVPMANASRSVPLLALPARPLRADDLAGVRLERSLRGYRMDQVDALLDRLVGELDADPATSDVSATPVVTGWGDAAQGTPWSPDPALPQTPRKD